MFVDSSDYMAGDMVTKLPKKPSIFTERLPRKKFNIFGARVMTPKVWAQATANSLKK